VPPANTPGAGQDDAAARRQQELQGSIEEKERRAVEESMRRRFGDQASQTTLTQEDFLSQDVHFAYDSYTLSDEAKSVLEQKASWMTARPDVSVQIEGHCDERGTIAYNLALGERRANTVKQYVTTLGITSSRLTTISYGEEFPLDPKHNEEAWARNRRAHFAIINQ
jgi:peptidoglycan-associated lipoprotein